MAGLCAYKSNYPSFPSIEMGEGNMEFFYIIGIYFALFGLSILFFIFLK